MLFDRSAVRRHHYDQRGGLEGARRKSRFAPIRHGKFTLVRIEFQMLRDDDGVLILDEQGNTIPEIRNGPKVSSISFKAVIAEGQQEGRWFFDRFVLKGFQPAVDRTRMNLAAMVSCYDRDPGPLRLGMVHGKVVPIMVRQEEHYQTGRPTNEILALSADPDFVYPQTEADLILDSLPVSDAEMHPRDAYHGIVSRCMKLDDKGLWKAPVPGWDLYPGSRSEKLVLKRERERQEIFAGAGVSAVDVRRRENSQKAVRRMAAG